MNDPQLLTVVFPQEEAGEISGRLEDVLKLALDGVRNIVLTSAEETRRYFLEGEQPPGRFRPVLFVVALGRDGVNLEYMKLLRVLRENKLVKTRRDGKVIYYSLADDHVKEIFETAVAHLKEEQMEREE